MSARLLKLGCIIAYLSKKCNIPLTVADKITAYRKKNSLIRHEYYSQCEKHVNMSKFMLTFTKSGTGTYSKLRIINEIKSYVTYLIANSSAEIYFFSNIEIGSKLNNPHLHTQIWCDDKKAVKALYEKVIIKFYLDASFCKFSKPQQPLKFYNYLIKEYASSLTDKQIWKLETTKRDMRAILGLKVRFYSKSKSKYTSKLYKMVYHVFGILRANADKFLNFFTNILFIGKKRIKAILGAKKRFFLESASSFILIKEQGVLFYPMVKVIFFRQDFSKGLYILFFSPATDPPDNYFYRCLWYELFDMTVSFALLVVKLI